MSKRKGNVLIIDDEEEIRESIELLLTSEGLSTDTATTGEEGLKKIEDNLYDAVLLDLMLPGKSGMEVQKEPSEEKKTKNKEIKSVNNNKKRKLLTKNCCLKIF